MKNILIISYFFAPANMMGAVRGTKLAKYLKRLGYNVTVICSVDNKLLFMPIDIKEDDTLKRDIKEVRCIRVSHSYIYKKIALILYNINKKLFPSGTIQSSPNKVNKKNKKNENIAKKYVKKIIQSIVYITTLLQDYDYKNQVIKHIKKEGVNLKDYDVVISTYGPLGSHLVGEKIKKMVKNITWIADFRDPMIMSADRNIQNRFSRHIQRRICKNSDYITAVSNGNLEMITENEYKSKAYTITNGYDLEDINPNSKNLKSKKLSFVYTGTTYAGKRNLSPIFKSISELIEEGKLDKGKIVFNYAGTEIEYVYNQASLYGIQYIIKDYGYISRTKSIELQTQADLLVVSTWNEKEHIGVLPGKFLEYMSYKKNIIGIINGDIAKSEMTSIIREYKLGIAYEQINDNIDYQNLKQYIYSKYKEWNYSGECVYEANIKKVESHDYKEICKQFIKLF